MRDVDRSLFIVFLRLICHAVDSSGYFTHSTRIYTEKDNTSNLPKLVCDGRLLDWWPSLHIDFYNHLRLSNVTTQRLSRAWTSTNFHIHKKLFRDME